MRIITTVAALLISTSALAKDQSGNVEINIGEAPAYTGAVRKFFETGNDTDRFITPRLDAGRSYYIHAHWNRLLSVQIRNRSGDYTVSAQQFDVGKVGTEFIPPVSDSYIIVVRNKSGVTNNQSYLLWLTNDCSETTNTVCNIDVGQTKNGLTSDRLDVDCHSIDLTVGQSHTFIVSGGVQDQWEYAPDIRDNNGRLLTYAPTDGDMTTAKIERFVPMYNGRHLICVGADGSDELVGTYNVKVQQP